MDAKIRDRLETDEGYATTVPLPGEAEPPRRRLVTLSPLNERRWSNFTKNRRGYWSLWIFLVLFIVTLLAEFIANDRPFLVKYADSYYMPIFAVYPETAFGGDFETEADYRDPVVACLIRAAGNEACFDAPETTAAEDGADGWMLWPLIRYSYDTINLDLPVPAPAPPTWQLERPDCEGVDPEDRDPRCTLGNWNWLGTDDQGRDVVARLIYGFRISVLFGLVLTFFSSIIGVMAGAVQGYFGGWTDLIFQRFIEIWTSVPSLYLLIIIASVIEPNFWILLGILLLFSWVALVGVVRAEFLRARNLEYVTAARALGVSNGKIMFKHVLPNAMVATLTFMPFILNGSITTLTSLDFLGFGLPPGSPSLGEMLAQGKANLQAPWLGLSGFFVIAIMLSLLIFIGEAVRDALDPRKVFQ